MKPAEKRWTVMLYMAASKDDQTEQAAIRDIRELEHVGSTKDLNVLVQIDRRWPGYAERYCVEKGYSRLCATLKGKRNIDSGKPQVLRDFVRWSRTKFPSDYYLLVLWGHSYGLGFGRDHDDPLTLSEIAASLDRQGLRAPIPEDRRSVDILGANACAMSYAECAYELQDTAEFLLAPEIAMPFAGWPYDRILTDIVDNPAIRPEELGKKIIERFMASFGEAVEPRNVSLTLLHLRHAQNIREHLTKLTATLSAALIPTKGRQGIREQVADAFLDTAHGDVRPLIDLFDLCERLAALDARQVSDYDGEAAAAVIDAAAALSHSLRPGGALVVDHRASAALEGIHGLGVFAPAVSGASRLMRVDSSIKEYEKLRLVKDTGWSDLAFTQLNRLLDPINRSVAEFVNASGATSREDRLGLAQLLVSVHRSFIRLEKALTDSQQQMARLLNGDAAGQRLERHVERSLGGNVTFGPPYLRLAAGNGEAAYLRRELKRAVTAVESVNDGEEDSSLLHAVAPLAKLEDALADVERTVKRVMTHSTLGLGDPKEDLGDPKEDLGDPKEDLGDPKEDLGDPKEDLGDPKEDLGPFSLPIAAASGYMTAGTGARAVTALYRQVAWSLQLLEKGIAKIESDVRVTLSSPTNGAKNSEYVRRTTEHMNQSFRALHELVSNARVTAGSVLSHPEYGLGPTPGRGVGAAIRRRLAIAGGLSSRFLHLL
jgi:hypothetical protein